MVKCIQFDGKRGDIFELGNIERLSGASCRKVTNYQNYFMKTHRRTHPSFSHCRTTLPEVCLLTDRHLTFVLPPHPGALEMCHVC